MEFSAAEEAIRADVVEKLRASFPGGRIVHELKVNGGQNRVDVATVLPDRIISVEIKSEKDTLKRLPKQMRAFQLVSDLVIVAAHRRHFDHTPYDNGSPRISFECPEHFGWPQVWCWPDAREINPVPKNADMYLWDTSKMLRRLNRPETGPLLDLLWLDELKEMAGSLRVSHASKATRKTIINEIRWHCCQREIVHGVCRALRSRFFVRADDPIKADGPQVEGQSDG